MDITKAKEFLEKQGLDDCHYQDSGMIEHIAEQMEMYHAEQLRLSAVMPSLPEGLDDDSNCDHNFKLGWIACWKALTGNVESCKHEYSHYTNEYNETVAVCEKCLDAYF